MKYEDGYIGTGQNDLHKHRFQSHSHAAYMFPCCFALF